MNWARAVETLTAGGTVTCRPKGRSMIPYIRPGQEVTIVPRTPARLVTPGEIVLAKVRGRYLLHRVRAVQGRTVQIANAAGHVNGWTGLGQVYGIVTAIR